MPELNEHELGVSDNLLKLESCEENREVALSMAQQARQSIEIISRLLDPSIYNTTEFIDAIRNFVTGNRNAQLRIIVFDPDTIVRNGHRLVELAGTLSSFIELRRAAFEHDLYSQSLLVVDGTAYLHRINTERYDATACFNDRRQSRFYQKEFNNMWETAKPDPNLRRMSL